MMIGFVSKQGTEKLSKRAQLQYLRHGIRRGIRRVNKVIEFNWCVFVYDNAF